MYKENLISVIVPVFNTEEYLNRCLDSIINSTYKGFLPLDESESVSGAGTESAVCGYGYRCRIQDGGDLGSS